MNTDSSKPRDVPADQPNEVVEELPQVAAKTWDGGENTVPLQETISRSAWEGAEQTQALVSPSASAGSSQLGGIEQWDGTENTQAIAQRAASSGTAWLGAALTQPLVATSDDPTPLLLSPQTAVQRSHAATQPLGAGMPTAHVHITSTFAPFVGKGRARTARIEDATPQTSPDLLGLAPRLQPATDTWHTIGTSGPLTGQVFGDYELGTVLGEGGMGIIYRARQRSLGRRVAVKTLSSAVSQDPVLRARFELEARAASLVRSPHVVQVFAAGTYNDIAYFVMEFVEGTHLGVVIQGYAEQEQPMPPDKAADFVLQAARGLSVASQHQIVHRDIKPGNLLIAKDGTLKIADFGISRIQGESHLTRTGTAIGTPSYVSPEQGRGEPCDGRSDLYSLGVVFYECLTGQKPFTGDTPNAVIYQHSYAEPKLPRELDSQIPEHWQAVVLKCLQKDPANRYQSASELVDDLERIRAGNLSITAVFNARFGTGADEAMRRYLGRGRTWLAPTLAAVLVVGLAAGGGLWWYQVKADERAESRRQLERLRSELRTSIDAPQPLPASAVADVDRVAALAGPQDPDVLRWRTKIATVGILTARLGRLDQATLADAKLAGESRADLDALTVLVGETYPGIDRWRARLRDTAAEISILRDKLTRIDRATLVSLTDREELTPDLGRFASLAGEQDADLTRWRARLVATDQRLAALTPTLAVLDDPTQTLSEARILQLGVVLDEYLALRGATHIDDAGVRWKGVIDARRDRLAALRSNLARLDEVDVVSDTTRARLQKDLADYTGLVSEGDPALARWQRRLAESERVIAGLRTRCAVLDHTSTLNHEQYLAAKADLETLRPLTATSDPEIKRWSAAVALVDDQVAADQLALAVLDDPAPVSRAQQVRAGQAIESLDARSLLREDAKLAYRKRLIAEAERLEALKRALAPADRTDVEITQGLVENVLLYGRLAGTDDADYQRWYSHVIRAVQLREALAPLDQIAPVPDRARDLLAEYAGIFGDDDPRVRTWRSKLDRVLALRRALDPLDRVAPVPDDGLALLDELLGLVGPFPGADQWRIKLSQIQDLRTALTAELAPTTIRLAPGARDHLAALGALIGIDEERMRRWSKRLAYLSGPGQPAWATRFVVDDAGAMAEATLPGEPPISIAFRYIPPGEFVMGSPLAEAGRDADEAQVQVTLSKGFWLAVDECRQDAWQRVMRDNPALLPNAEAPVQRVSWEDAQIFLAKLKQLLPTLKARLPTEAEWEHAARAGETATWIGPRGAVGPTDLPRISWFAEGEDPGLGTRAAGRRQPNPLGLHDLQGNVWEWCEDRYGYYSPVPITDPVGFESELRVARGGSWGEDSRGIRLANRLPLEPSLRSWFVGIRLAAPAELPPDVQLDLNRQAAQAELESIEPTGAGAVK